MAFGGVYTGFMGVVATLRMQFAQTITLGVVIGATFSQLAQASLQPVSCHLFRARALLALSISYSADFCFTRQVFTRLVPQEYHKWIPVSIDWVCKAIGISVAWTVQRVISGFYSAVRGAQLASRGILRWAVHYKFLPAGFEDEGNYYYAVGVAASTCVLVSRISRETC